VLGGLDLLGGHQRLTVPRASALIAMAGTKRSPIGTLRISPERLRNGIACQSAKKRQTTLKAMKA
jgi:hypothetical protein